MTSDSKAEQGAALAIEPIELNAEQGAAETSDPVKPEDTRAEESLKGESEAGLEDKKDEAEPERRTSEDRRKSRDRARISDLEAENSRLRQLTPLQDEAAILQQLVEREIGPAPKQSDFKDFLEYEAERQAYIVDKRQTEREIKRKAAEFQQSQERQAEEVREAFLDRIAAARKAIPDFDQVTQAATVSPRHAEVIDIILRSEIGAELSYYLSKNPAEVTRINEMTPVMAAREVGRLEARLSRAEPRTQTKAPEPVPAIKGGLDTTKRKDPSEMNMAEYIAWRKTGGGR